MMNLVRFHLGQAVTERCDAERGDEAGDEANNCLEHYTRAAGRAGFPTSLINERKPTAGLHRKLPGGDSTLRVLGLWGFEAGASVWSRLAWLVMEEISAGASLRRNELPKPMLVGLVLEALLPPRVCGAGGCRQSLWEGICSAQGV